jgi:phage baseplate assembly protein W
MKGIVFYNQNFLVVQEDEDVIQENISRILLTSPGERVNNPTFGSLFKQYIFAQDVVMMEEIKSEAYKSISRWEPRLAISNIVTEQINDNTMRIHIDGIYKETLEPFTYEKTIQY